MNGCQWAEWAPFSVCSKTCGGGRKVMMMSIMSIKWAPSPQKKDNQLHHYQTRTREKLPGMGTCDGDAEQTVVCSEQEVPPSFYIFIIVLVIIVVIVVINIIIIIETCRCVL